jgi:hypothetical protein
MGIDEARDLAVGLGSAQHREHRDEQQWPQRVRAVQCYKCFYVNRLRALCPN